MNDAEYIFKQTSAERKRIGRGDYHKKRQGGRQVRLPSDHMTKKELAALSSDVTQFNLNAPVCWAEFKNWPDDLKIEYLQKLETRYHATTEDIAIMMDIGYKPLAQLKRDLGIAGKRGGKRPPLDTDGWERFWIVNDPRVLASAEKCPEPTEEPAEKSPELPVCHGDCGSPTEEEAKKKIALGMDSVMNIAILLDALKGSGAKLTIEVTL